MACENSISSVQEVLQELKGSDETWHAYTASDCETRWRDFRGIVNGVFQ